jgi:hypothetical protein
MGEELRNDAVGLTLTIDHSRHIQQGDYNKACRLCGLLEDTRYSHGGWFPAVIRPSIEAKALTTPEWKGKDVFGTLQCDHGIFRPQKVPARYDHGLVRLWIDNCTDYHAFCSGREPVVEGMRLNDCHTGEIVEAEPNSRWVALSYVWGDDTSRNTMQRPLEEVIFKRHHPRSRHWQRKRTAKYHTDLRIERHTSSLQQSTTR